MNKVIALLLILGTFLAGCTGNTPDRFTGEWTRPKYPNQTLTVTSEGGAKLSFVQLENGRPRDPIVGVFDGDSVVFNGGAGTANLRADGSLSFGAWQYVRR